MVARTHKKKAYRILFIDDEPPLLFAFKRYFESLGHEVDCACDVEEALGLLTHVADASYALVITDLRLNVACGAEGLDVIRHTRRFCPEARVILLTAFASPEVQHQAYRQGVDRVLQKPMRLPDLAQIAYSLIEKRA